MGGKLWRAFRDAGLPAPEMIAGGRVEGGTDAYAFDYIAQTLRSLLPVAERVGSATRAEMELETLAERLRVGAWTRVPG